MKVNHFFQFIQLKESINRKDENSDSSKVASFQNSLADFGAKLQELTLQVNSLKNYSREERTKADTDRALLAKLQETINTNANSMLPQSTNYMNQTQEILNGFRADFTKELKNVSFVLTNVNDTLSQKTNEIYDQLRKHKVRNLIYHRRQLCRF